MNIIYFPGFGGKENSITFQTISKHFPTSKFVKYDNENPENAFVQIQNQLEKWNIENTVIIGQSLGGFWAEIFADKYNLKTILINPSLEPNLSLKKYNLPEKFLDLFLKFKSNEKLKQKITIILSENDTIVNPKFVKEKYSNIAKFVSVKGDHIFRNYDILFEELEKL